MKHIAKIIKLSFFVPLLAVVILASCNKQPEQFPLPVTPTPTGVSLGATLAANPDDSLYLAMVKRGGLLSTINNVATSFTMFVPDNDAMKIFVNAASGGAIPITAPDSYFSAFISTTLPAATAFAIVSYNIIPQALHTADIPTTFPNFQYPSIFNPAPQVSPLLRLTTFPSRTNGTWVNNIPLTTVDIAASNGVIHNSAFLVTPPSRYLWDRISSDTDLTYLKAAVNRADSGTPAPGFLQGVLLNIGANLTVFAPTDSAFRVILTGAIYEGVLPQVIQYLTGLYIGGGATPEDAAAQAAIDAPPIALSQATAYASTPDVFSNPLFFEKLTAQTVQGILFYHLFGNRAFSNNFPTASTAYPTLLNSAIPTHPGVTISATFTGPFVSSATVKGAYNDTPSNIIINASPLIPEPFGTSDQHYLNGVLHKIDQVLIPLPL